MSGNKIVFINHWALNIGGAEHSLLDILEEMAGRTEVHLVTAETGPLTERAETMGIKCHIIHCSGSLADVKRGNLLLTALLHWRGMISFSVYVHKVCRLIKDIQPGLVHANVPKSHITLFLLRMLGYKGKCCFHIRELFKFRTIPYLLYDVLFPAADATAIAISDSVKNSLPGRIRMKTIVIYNGVKIPSGKTPHAKTGTRFIYLGRIVPWKGCHHLIEAFALVRKRCAAGCRLSIVGGTFYWNESYRRQLEALIALRGLGDACVMRPHTQTPYDVLMEHDVLCLPSDREPFGRVAAEAQACGLPVIAFDNGGTREVVLNGVTGFLIPYGDIESFASAMERFVNEESLAASMGTAGRERAGVLFNKDIQIPKIADYLVDACQDYH